MVKKIVSRAAFSRLAGVSAAAISKACDGPLKEACDGKRINANHASALAYLGNHSKQKAAPAAPSGIDPLYYDAVKACKESGRWSAHGIREILNIGSNRAGKIFNTMKAAGDIPEKKSPAKITKDERTDDRETEKKTNTARGHTAKNETKKLEGSRLDDPLGAPEDIQVYLDMSLRELINKFGTDSYFVDWLKATKSIEDIAEKRIKNAALEGTLISRDVVKTGIIDPLNGAFIRMLSDGSKTIAVRAKALIDSGGDVAAVEELVAKQLTSFINPTKSKMSRVLKNA